MEANFVVITTFLITQRSRRGGGFSRKPAAPSRSVPARRPASTPAPAQQSSGGGMMSGLASTVAQGMAFGTGSAIAHRAVGAVAGSFGGSEGDAEIPAQTSQQMGYEQQPTLASACADDKQMFYECLQMNKGDQSSCQFLYDALKTCQRSNTEQVQFN